jgi:hypothetical protein
MNRRSDDERDLLRHGRTGTDRLRVTAVTIAAAPLHAIQPHRGGQDMNVLAAASLALLASAGLAATAPAAGAQELNSVCAEHDVSIRADDAKDCVRESFALVSGGGDAITQDQLAQAYGRAEAARRLFSQIDRNGDGQITPEEWAGWHATDFAAATESNQGSRRPTSFPARRHPQAAQFQSKTPQIRIPRRETQSYGRPD